MVAVSSFIYLNSQSCAASLAFARLWPASVFRQRAACELFIAIALLTSGFLVSGLSAAHTIYLAGGNVVVLDKQGE